MSAKNVQNGKTTRVQLKSFLQQVPQFVKEFYDDEPEEDMTLLYEDGERPFRLSLELKVEGQDSAGSVQRITGKKRKVTQEQSMEKDQE